MKKGKSKEILNKDERHQTTSPRILVTRFAYLFLEFFIEKKKNNNKM